MAEKFIMTGERINHVGKPNSGWGSGIVYVGGESEPLIVEKASSDILDIISRCQTKGGRGGEILVLVGGNGGLINQRALSDRAIAKR